MWLHRPITVRWIILKTNINQTVSLQYEQNNSWQTTILPIAKRSNGREWWWTVSTYVKFHCLIHALFFKKKKKTLIQKKEVGNVQYMYSTFLCTVHTYGKDRNKDLRSVQAVHTSFSIEQKNPAAGGRYLCRKQYRLAATEFFTFLP